MSRTVLGQNQHITAENVIHIDPLLRQNINVGDIAGGTLEMIIQLRTTDDKGVFKTELAQLCFQAGGLAIGLEAIENDQLAITGLDRKRGTQAKGANLFLEAVVMITNNRAMRNTTTTENVG